MQRPILVVIPARGSSKGIPRKNLRPLLGRPLIHYVISTVLSSAHEPDIFVSSEDSEILSVAAQAGARTHRRDDQLSADQTTLDPVIINATKDIQKQTELQYELVITVQPTSPLLKTASLDNAIQLAFDDPSVDTVISAVEDTHLSWRQEGDQFISNYKERLNRQYLEPQFRETGGFVVARPGNFENGSRIGKNVRLYVLPREEAVDIDHSVDWSICEHFLRRKRIVFAVSGHPRIGLGHAYNTLAVAHELVEHELVFLVDRDSDLAAEKIAEHNYPVVRQGQGKLVDEILQLEPDVVINDRLDTDEEYVVNLKQRVARVINFEDLGPGAGCADLVINAIYPETRVLPRHYFGPRYFCLRDEFLGVAPREIRARVKRVLLSFGGVDPNNLTKKTLDAIHGECAARSIEITVVAGLGYQWLESLHHYPSVDVVRNVQNIADYMRQADVCFTSAGRTIYELAAVGVPTIVLAQNERELTHFFASEQYGFVNVGLGTRVSEHEIHEYFLELIDSADARRYMQQLMLEWDVTMGRARVADLIRQTIEEA